MSESVYVVNEIVGASGRSWEDAARQAIETAAGSIGELRIGEAAKQDATVDDGKLTNYRVRLNIAFRYHP
jgi:dodecin